MSEFKNLPSGWKVVRLGDVFDIQSGSTPSRQNFYYWENTSIYWVKTTDLNNNFISDTEEKISEIGLKESSCKVYPKNTILIAMYGGFNQIGRTGILQIEAATNQAISALLPSAKANSLFVNNILICYRNKWKNIAISSRKDPNITKRDIENFKIPLPPLDEQEKIAEILSTWDEAINLTINLIENKKQFKKALMQNLLIAKIRFPEFQDEWEEIKLEKIFTEYTLLNNDKLKQYTIGKNGIKEIDDCNYEVDKHKIFMKNDFIVGIGIDEMNVNINLDKGSCSPIYHVYSTNENLVVPKFIYYYARRAVEKIKPFITKKSTRREYEFNAKEFIKHKILAPSLKEQQKIAEVLTACDDEINLLNLKLENLKKAKQGLRQKLLKGEIKTCHTKKTMQ